MSGGRICVRTVSVASPDEPVREAARRMREADVGTLVVVDGKRNPMGILTDRDVTLRCVAEGRDPDTTSVADVMTTPVLCVSESSPIEEALGRMAGIAGRRLAVVKNLRSPLFRNRARTVHSLRRRERPYPHRNRPMMKTLSSAVF